jgi:hypothetical protein
LACKTSPGSPHKELKYNGFCRCRTNGINCGFPESAELPQYASAATTPEGARDEDRTATPALLSVLIDADNTSPQIAGGPTARAKAKAK